MAYSKKTHQNFIEIKGAKENNLKNISLKIPRDAFTVITGLSGSGKSSLAFDTIYAEGQRRYVESLNSYARQFLGIMKKPIVESIEGLSPAISIEQKTTHKNPRSTIATVTEIYDYLRLLYARIGEIECYQCQRVLENQTIQKIVDRILSLPIKSRIMVIAPLVRGKKGEYKKLLEKLQKDGFPKVRINQEIFDLEDKIELNKQQKHTIEVIVDRLIIQPKIRQRLTDSIETSLKLSDNLVSIIYSNENTNDHQEDLYSTRYGCVHCDIYYEEIEPRSFSFNSPFGSCKTCDGLGVLTDFNEESLIENRDLSINQGCFSLFNEENSNWYFTQVKVICLQNKIDMNIPWKKIPVDSQQIILNGNDSLVTISYGKSICYETPFEGLLNNLRKRYQETKSSRARKFISRFMDTINCPDCLGKRLRRESLNVKIKKFNIDDFCKLTISNSIEFIESLILTKNQKKISAQIIKEIQNRLGFLHKVGLSYLTLNRKAETLSGGEAQRIRLASQIGSQLCGVLYILDEPSIGLHQRDNTKLLSALQNLRDLGNTVIVVEHDQETIEQADFVVDIGPGAGVNGGEVVIADIPKKVSQESKSLTGQYLSGKLRIEIPSKLRKKNGRFLKIFGANGNNLKNITISIPLEAMTVITGVSGSGKSTLVKGTLFPILSQHFYSSKQKPLGYKKIEGLEYLNKVIHIDQSPIGRTPRSNPATYTGLFTPLRDIFASLKESIIRGYQIGRFSFNVKGGRCEACEGDGVKKIEMHFLSDVYVTCEQCKGKRYNRETLEILYKEYSISDILDFSVAEALKVFENIPKIKDKLQTLFDVGLSYIKLGQPATTLSGGEAQRIKLATELSKKGTGQTFYILDEPTTGLHFEDVRLLLIVLNSLIDKGNTVLIIEHNLDVIKTADYLIDIGPEGGKDGGEVLACGTPKQVSKNEKSYTGIYLKEIFNKSFSKKNDK